MPSLLSGSTLRRGGSGEFIDLAGAQPQLPATATTTTGYTLITNSVLQSRYASSLGNIEFYQGNLYSNLVDGVITVLTTGTTSASISTSTGNLVVQGGVGIGRNLYVKEDIVVNGITMGRGYEGQNNIVIKGVADIPLYDYNDGQENIIIGYDALQGLTTAYKNIAIGRYALSSGTNVRNSIAIGDSALKNLGVTNYTPLAAIVGLTTGTELLITSISNATPAIVTSVNHGISTGTKIYIAEVSGITTGSISLVNNQPFWVDVVTTSTLALYLNNALTTPLDSTSATVYTSSGTISTPIILSATNHGIISGTSVIIVDVNGMIDLNDQQFYVDAFTSNTLALYSNIILTTPVTGRGYTPYTSSGTIARLLLRDNNIAIGNNAGTSLIDGEKNYFFGDQIAKNLTTGSYNFFVGNDVGANITHGSNIIAFGGDNLVDGVDNQVNIGSVFYYNGNSFATINANTEVGLGEESTSSTSGGLTVIGGAGVSGNAYIGGELHVTSTGTSTFSGNIVPVGSVNLGSASNPFNALYLKGSTLYLSTVTLKSASDLAFSVESTAGYVTQTVGNLHLNSGVESSGTTLGALVVTGGVGVSGNVNIYKELNVEGVGDVNLNPVGKTVYIEPTGVRGQVQIHPGGGGTLNNMVIGDTNPADGTFNDVKIKTATISTSTNTGALVVEGGVGINGNIYSKDGNPDENGLLYTPRVFVSVSTSTPATPRVGDVWIAPDIFAYMQYIKDGTSTYWIQVSSI